MVVDGSGVHMRRDHHFKPISPHPLGKLYADLVCGHTVHLATLETLVGVKADDPADLPAVIDLGIQKLPCGNLWFRVAKDSRHKQLLLGFHFIGTVLQHPIHRMKGRNRRKLPRIGFVPIGDILHNGCNIVPVDCPDARYRHVLRRPSQSPNDCPNTASIRLTCSLMLRSDTSSTKPSARALTSS